MRRELGIRAVTTAYGLTECGGLATICNPDDDAATIAGTSGKAIPGTEVCILDRNRSLSGVLLPAMLTRNNRPPVQSGGTRSDQSDGKQQQVAAA